MPRLPKDCNYTKLIRLLNELSIVTGETKETLVSKLR